MAGNGLDYVSKLELENIELRSRVEMLYRNVFSDDIEECVAAREEDFWYICTYIYTDENEKVLKDVYPQFSYSYALATFSKMIHNNLKDVFCLSLKVGKMSNYENSYYSVKLMPYVIEVFLKDQKATNIITADIASQYSEIVEMAESIDSPVRVYNHAT